MRVRLGDITKVKTGKLDANASCINGKYPFFTCSKQSLKIDSYSYDCECVLVAGNGDLNVKYYKGKFDAYQRTYIIEDDSDGKLYMPFLYYFMENYVDELRSQAIGGVIKYIKLGNITNAIINLPSIAEQKDIVVKIKKTENIKEKKKKQLELLDELVKARFVEMFGEMKETTKLSRYITELRAGKSLAGTKICKNKVLKTGAATFGYFDKTQFKYYPEDYEPNPLHKVEDGDVIISRMNTPNLVGSCSYVYKAPKDTYYPDRLWKTIVSENTNPIFLWHLLWQQEIRKQIKENSFGTSGTMNNISKVKMLNIKAIDVSIELQDQFADFVRETDKSRLHVLSISQLQFCLK